MNKKLKRLTAAGLATVTALTALSSCGEKKEPVLEKRTNVYSGAEYNLPEGVDNVQKVFTRGNDVGLLYDKVYTILYNDKDEEVKRTPGYSWTDEETLSDGWYQNYENTTYTAIFNSETSEITETPLNFETQTETYNAYIRSATCDSDGNVWTLVCRWDYAENYEETYESTRTFRLCSFDAASGEMTNEIILSDALEAAGYENGDVYIYNFAYANGMTYINTESAIVAIDNSGTFKEKIEMDEDGWLNSMYCDGNTLYVTYYSDNGSQKLKKIENGQITDIEGENLGGILGNSNSIYSIAGSKMYYGTTSGVFVYDMTNDTTSELMNYINSDLDSNIVSSVLVMPDERIALLQTDWSGEVTKNTISLMSRVPDEELQDEIILELGWLYSDYYLNKSIIRFNKQNTGVRVSVRDYSEYNNEENEWTGAVTQFKNDMIVGNVPDIVLLNTELPVESYFQKGTFVDLNKYIDDPENGIDRSKYLANIFEACEVDGKLNSMIVSFTLYTLAAKSQYVGTEPGWTLDEMMETIRNMPEGMEAFMEYSRDDILEYMFTYSMDTFVDWSTGETHFGDTAFIEFIEFLANCNEKGFWERMYNDDGEYVYDEELEKEYSMQYQLRFYKDYSMFYMTNISSFTRIMNIRAQFASSDITLIGYPTNDEKSNGSTIVPQAELAISAQSLAQDEAWSFIKFVLEDTEYAESLWTFTPNIELLNKMKSVAKENYSYYKYDEESLAWYKEYYSDDYYEYMKSRNQPLDESTLDQTMELLQGAYKVQRNDTSLLEIIKEELSAFFAGTRSAEETAKIIDSRARIYVSQNS